MPPFGGTAAGREQNRGVMKIISSGKVFGGGVQSQIYVRIGLEEQHESKAGTKGARQAAKGHLRP